MLRPMEIGVDTLRRIARLAGFDWTDAELAASLPAMERMLALLARLDAMPLAEVEPATQYRVL